MLKKIKCDIKDFDFKNNIITSSTLQFNKIKNKYYLLIKYKRKPIKNKSVNIISLDPGIIMPFTGYANNKIVDIGCNVNKYIKHKLYAIDDIKSKFKQAIIKCNKIYERIKNRVNDFHWKTIKYLLDDHNIVLIGNLSTKRMGESNGDKMTKRIGNCLNFFKFKERLKYKCSNRNKKYKEVNESYTSKICCQCGHNKHDLGSNKIYKCDICNLKIKRDINGAINILLKSLI